MDLKSCLATKSSAAPHQALINRQQQKKSVYYFSNRQCTHIIEAVLWSRSRMFTGGILSEVGQKRRRESSSNYPPFRQPQYGRSGLLARAADEEFMNFLAKQQQQKQKPCQQNAAVTARSVTTSELSKFIPSPFVLPPMLIAGSITSSNKRLLEDEIGALRARLRVLTRGGGDVNSTTYSPLEEAREALVERFVVPITGGDGETSDLYDEQSATDASSALEEFNKAVIDEIDKVRRRIESLEDQLESGRSTTTSNKEAVALLPTSYLQGLLQYSHFLNAGADGVLREGLACAEEEAAVSRRKNSILPLPAMAERMLTGAQKADENLDSGQNSAPRVCRPNPSAEAASAFDAFLRGSVRSIDTSFTRVELPLTMNVVDLDVAERSKYPPVPTGVVGPDGKPIYSSSINSKSHTKLTRSMQIVVLKEGKAIVGQRPIVALQLVGEKYYEVDSQSKDPHTSDPLAALGLYDGNAAAGLSSAKPQYRFHLLPFPNLSAEEGKGDAERPPNTVTVDSVAIFGRNSDNSTVLAEHPSISGQHMALFWTLAYTRKPLLNEQGAAPKRETPSAPLTVSETQWFLELHVADLGASNGTALLGGGSPHSALPKAPISVCEVPSSTLVSSSVTSPTTSSAQSQLDGATQFGVASTETSSAVVKVVCPFVAEHTAGGSSACPKYSLPQDVGFGPLGTASYTVMEGDQLAMGVSTRRYVVVSDEAGVVSGV